MNDPYLFGNGSLQLYFFNIQGEKRMTFEYVFIYLKVLLYNPNQYRNKQCILDLNMFYPVSLNIQNIQKPHLKSEQRNFGKGNEIFTELS